MNKKFKKGLTITTAAAIGMGVVLPTVTVMAAPAKATGWNLQNNTWYYYKNGVKVKNGWAKDCIGWCYLSDDGSWCQEGWKKDSHGWVYIRNGYKVEDATWAKDSAGWQYIGLDGYWVQAISPKATNPILDADAALSKAEASKLQADIDVAAVLVNALEVGVHEKTPLVTRLAVLKAAL